MDPLEKHHTLAGRWFAVDRNGNGTGRILGGSEDENAGFAESIRDIAIPCQPSIELEVPRQRRSGFHLEDGWWEHLEDRQHGEELSAIALGCDALRLAAVVELVHEFEGIGIAE